MMESKVKWYGDMSFVGETGSGHCVVMDGAPAAGGRNLAARPMEMVLIGLGGCNAFDLVSTLKQRNRDLRGLEIRIQARRADQQPAVFTHIDLLYVVTGLGIDKEEVEAIVSLSMKKLSSVASMLAKTAKIEYEIEFKESS